MGIHSNAQEMSKFSSVEVYHEVTIGVRWILFQMKVLVHTLQFTISLIAL
jgi:hypothetical protein